MKTNGSALWIRKHPNWVMALAWLVAAFITVYVGRYAYRVGVSVAVADSWNFVEGFVAHYNSGTLGLSDFFGKRPFGYDHSQPIQRAVLWLHMQIFQMDFGAEGAFGCIFAAGLGALCSRLTSQALYTRRHGVEMAALILVAIFAAIFSLNARSVFDWSLVTLVFADILGAVLLVAYAYTCLYEKRPLALFVATFIACALMDTVAIMAVIAIAILFVLAAIRPQAGHSYLRPLACLIAAAVLYKVVYTWMFLGGHASAESTLDHASNLLRDWKESWKALVVPLGGAVLSSSRLNQHHPAYLWAALSLGAAGMALPSAWFWLTYFRHATKRLPFIAAGLMLICYGSVAGVLIIRVPEYGFDYLLQPRYTLFYTLQLVALLMMGAYAWSLNPGRGMSGALIGGAIAVIALWVVYARATVSEEPFVRAYNQQMADQIHAMWLNPAATPEPCSPNILPCHWKTEQREAAIGELAKGPWNVFSPSFRHRHGLRWFDKQLPEP